MTKPLLKDPSVHTLEMREWRAAHPENVDYQRDYHKRYTSDPVKRDAARARARAWYHANRERAIAREHNRYHSTKVLKGRPEGETHHAWKGADAGYFAVHSWVARHRGTPSLCEHCGTTTATHYQWANKSRQYLRELDDWIRLCIPCHQQYDDVHAKAAATRQAKSI